MHCFLCKNCFSYRGFWNFSPYVCENLSTKILHDTDCGNMLMITTETSPVCNIKAPGAMRLLPPGFHGHERPGWEAIIRGVSWSSTQETCPRVWGRDQHHLHLASSWMLHTQHHLHVLHKPNLAVRRHLKGDCHHTALIHTKCSYRVAQGDQLFPLDTATLLWRHILPRSSDCNCFTSVKNSKTKPEGREGSSWKPNLPLFT